MKKRSSLPDQRFTSWDDLREIPGLGKVMLDSLKTFCLDPAQNLDPLAATHKHPVFMIATQGTLGSTERHVMGADIGHLLTLWTQTSQQKPGKMYQDSGCKHCVAGHDVHDVWQRYLSSQGLTPVRLNKKEENCKVEISDCAFQYPVFFEGTLRGSIDVARIPVACPALFSKRAMRECKHVLDFASKC